MHPFARAIRAGANGPARAPWSRHGTARASPPAADRASVSHWVPALSQYLLPALALLAAQRAARPLCQPCRCVPALRRACGDAWGASQGVHAQASASEAQRPDLARWAVAARVGAPVSRVSLAQTCWIRRAQHPRCAQTQPQQAEVPDWRA